MVETQYTEHKAEWRKNYFNMQFSSVVAMQYAWIECLRTITFGVILHVLDLHCSLYILQSEKVSISYAVFKRIHSHLLYFVLDLNGKKYRIFAEQQSKILILIYEMTGMFISIHNVRRTCTCTEHSHYYKLVFLHWRDFVFLCNIVYSLNTIRCKMNSEKKNLF